MIPRGDRGSASIWLLGAGFVVVAVGLASALATAATTARHRAQAAADLGALAGARYVIDGAPAACARAGLVVSENGARMAGCRLDALDVVVTAEETVPGFGSARAVARAGPLRTTGAAGGRDRSPGQVSWKTGQVSWKKRVSWVYQSMFFVEYSHSSCSNSSFSISCWTS